MKSITKMQITIVSGLNLDAGFGGEIWITTVAKKLSINNKVKIITSTNGPRNTNFKTTLINYGVEVTEIKYSHLFQSITVLFKSFKTSNVVYYSSFGLIPKTLVIVLSKLLQVPVINGHHASTFDKDKMLGGKVQKKLYSFLFTIIHNFVDSLYTSHHVENHEDLNALRRIGIHKIFVIPFGVDLGYYRPEVKFDTFTILWVGRVDHNKGADKLPSIIPDLLLEIKNINILFAGDGPLRNIIEDLVKKYHNVTYLGFVSDENKRFLMAKSHLFFSTSLTETSPQAGLQALASGTPIIYFKIKGASEIIKNGVNGYLVSDSKEYITAVKTIYSLWISGKYQEISSNSRRSVENLDQTKMVESIESMIISTAR